MLSTLSSIKTLTLVALLGMSSHTLVAAATLSGTVQNVDPDQGRLTLALEAGDTVELHAPPELLASLQSGDAVEVYVSGKKATMIRKQDDTQRPDIGGTLRLQPPESLRQAP